MGHTLPAVDREALARSELLHDCTAAEQGPGAHAKGGSA